VKKILYILFFASIALQTQAETVYVTDNLRVNLRKQANKDSDVVAVVSSGAPLTVLETTASGYRKVRTQSGREGYLLTRFTVATPPAVFRLREAKKEISRLKAENAQLLGQMDDLLDNPDDPDENKQTLAERRNKLIQEIMELRQASKHVMAIKQQRDQLQERVVNLERELQQVKREKQALTDSSNQDWFLYGGILAFTGIFLGLLIPKLTTQQRSGWGSPY